jgi:hypothetical protein
MQSISRRDVWGLPPVPDFGPMRCRNASHFAVSTPAGRKFRFDASNLERRDLAKPDRITYLASHAQL